MWKEFKEFIARGNVIDLAVAVILGAAFNLVVQSLVNDVITPIIGMLLGGLDFIKNLSFTLGSATIKYGAFIQAIINFLITAFALFLIIQAYNRFKRKEDKKEEVKNEVQPSQEVVLLTQIRDLMERNNGGQAAAARAQQGAPPPNNPRIS
jgi:large conductance mechanosensitive channel